MKCPNCGAEISKDTKFCSNCGNAIEFSKQKDSNNYNDSNSIINTILANPKLIIMAIVVILLLFGIMSIFNSGSGNVNSNGASDITVYGLNFHIPDGYVESDRGDLTNGETVDLKDNGYIIEISVSADRNFKESKYIDSKVDMTINGKQGTLYQYKAPSKGIAYVYNDGGNLVVIRGAGPSELKEMIV